MFLLEATLWHEWYVSAYSANTLGVIMPDVLFVEYPKGNARHFRKPKQLHKFLSAIEKITLDEPQKMEMIFTDGLALIEKAKKLIRTPDKIESFDATVDLLIRLGLQTANIPRVALNIIVEKKLRLPKLTKLAEKIRKQTVYPEFTKKVVIPSAAEILKNEGVKNPFYKVNYLTYRELKNKKFNLIDRRVFERKKGKLLLFKNDQGGEVIKFSSENRKLLANLTAISFAKKPEIHGIVANRGKVFGKVRVILNNRKKEFSVGDVLVSISSSPELIPYIRKCGAIVTDEGGLGCHAAVISRELKKPCVIGTKIATQVLKDGDMVEVDATKGIVRKL